MIQKLLNCLLTSSAEFLFVLFGELVLRVVLARQLLPVFRFLVDEVTNYTSWASLLSFCALCAVSFQGFFDVRYKKMITMKKCRWLIPSHARGVRKNQDATYDDIPYWIMFHWMSLNLFLLCQMTCRFMWLYSSSSYLFIIHFKIPGHLLMFKILNRSRIPFFFTGLTFVLSFNTPILQNTSKMKTCFQIILISSIQFSFYNFLSNFT